MTAVVGKQQAQVVIKVLIRGSQNGADPSIPGQALQIPSGVGKLTEGGGPGGVGGQGLGVPVKDKDVLEALDDPSSDGSDVNLKLVYPYDGTVFPRGRPGAARRLGLEQGRRRCDQDRAVEQERLISMVG